ncbi:hypothetical protein ACQ9BO_08965 [Flavobacterium sp. P21]|uniref:hypothetical protein n=1 Tax=Flavobacterium sp. P21 TaxID=3423948 RepID=UPI003D6669C1
MNNLLEFTINAHGGIDTWKKFENISAKLVTGGVLWPMKRQSGIIDTVNVTSDTKKNLRPTTLLLRKTGIPLLKLDV